MCHTLRARRIHGVITKVNIVSVCLILLFAHLSMAFRSNICNYEKSCYVNCFLSLRTRYFNGSIYYFDKKFNLTMRYRRTFFIALFWLCRRYVYDLCAPRFFFKFNSMSHSWRRLKPNTEYISDEICMTFSRLFVRLLHQYSVTCY